MNYNKPIAFISIEQLMKLVERKISAKIKRNVFKIIPIVQRHSSAFVMIVRTDHVVNYQQKAIVYLLTSYLAIKFDRTYLSINNVQ